MRLRDVLDGFVAEALGRHRRADPVRPTSGGPAGNARLTAGVGLVLLVLFVAELITLLDVHTWLNWHVALGVLLIPPALVKTGSTGWRIVRYYTGDAAYREAGPPTLILRVLGPLVVASTLAVLGTGVALILMSPTTAVRPLVTVAGFGVGPLQLHQGAFLVWAVATGLHVLGRLVPAVVTAFARPVPGAAGRASAFVVIVLVAALAAMVAVPADAAWRAGHPFGHRHHHARAAR